MDDYDDLFEMLFWLFAPWRICLIVALGLLGWWAWSVYA